MLFRNAQLGLLAQAPAQPCPIDGGRFIGARPIRSCQLLPVFRVRFSPVLGSSPSGNACFIRQLGTHAALVFSSILS